MTSACETPLDRIRAAWRTGPYPPAPAAATLTRRADHFADGVRFLLEQPGALGRVRAATATLEDDPPVEALVQTVLETALSLTRAELGNVQLVDPASGALLITDQSGFDAEFLEHFSVVDDDSSACGRASHGDQTILHDVDTDPGFASHRGIAAAAGFRSVQSTPLIDFTGRVVGIVSTHFPRPHRPTPADLQILQLFADYAGDAISRSLGPPAETPPRNHHALPSTAVSPETIGMGTELAGSVVDHLLTALHLTGLRRLVGEGAASARLQAAVDTLDRAIHDIENHTLSTRSILDTP
ncbi:GAF domain-containing protein [Nocardia sp. NEAU-G5]|uniref:GAF domain-containing protein n=1 Tax=Nocardia albiluteola TaxID=2842303 RepID=A0ABS6AZY9_9NOCA|nr:GAF domain-containing protein [Nocardia albiluteola]MBU3062578.1 GAF domain-containing protein [Nocardia albiluteola]MBU3065588.1 GAF domain-containing protein [Nocardia albiluteola]